MSLHMDCDTVFDENQQQIFSNDLQIQALRTDGQAEHFLPYNSCARPAAVKLQAAAMFPQKHFYRQIFDITGITYTGGWWTGSQKQPTKILLYGFICSMNCLEWTCPSKLPLCPVQTQPGLLPSEKCCCGEQQPQQRSLHRLLDARSSPRKQCKGR